MNYQEECLNNLKATINAFKSHPLEGGNAKRLETHYDKLLSIMKEAENLDLFTISVPWIDQKLNQINLASLADLSTRIMGIIHTSKTKTQHIDETRTINTPDIKVDEWSIYELAEQDIKNMKFDGTEQSIDIIIAKIKENPTTTEEGKAMQYFHRVIKDIIKAAKEEQEDITRFWIKKQLRKTFCLDYLGQPSARPHTCVCEPYILALAKEAQQVKKDALLTHQEVGKSQIPSTSESLIPSSKDKANK